MSFLDQFSIWEILVGLVLILVVNTVVFKLLVDWNQAQPLDDGESLAASPPGPASSLAGGELETSSFATASVPLPNRPRRRKHLQASASSASVSAAPDVPDTDNRVESPVPKAETPVSDVVPTVPSPEQPAASSVVSLRSVLTEEPPAAAEKLLPPVIAFNPEPRGETVDPIEPGKHVPLPPVAPEAAKEERPAPPEPAVPLIPLAPEPVAFAVEAPAPGLTEKAPEPATESPAPAPVVNIIAPEPPVAAPPAPAEPTSPEPVAGGTPAREDRNVIPSSDLVLTSSASPGLTGGPDAPAKLTPEATAPPSGRPPETTAVRPSAFRRAVAPARLFLTREFSSVRIRSRQLTPEPGATAAAGEVPATVPPAGLRSSEPATAAEVTMPFADTPALTPEPAPEPVVTPVPAAAEESSPIKGTSTPAEVTAPEVEATIPPAEPAPEHTAVTAPTPLPVEPTPVPVDLPQEREPLASAPEPEPVHPTAEAAAPTPGSEVSETRPSVVIPVPEPSETLPVVDIPTEATILPPPSVVPEAPSAQSEPIAIRQPIAPFISTPTMASVQPVTGERATAQLTLSLEVSSLQLTPAFKLGSVQLRPLSNVVSLQLGAGAGPKPADNPLAANISFEIQSVQTGGDGQIQSLVLKPLLQARADTTPHPKLQVDAVQLTRGVEAGPIQITPAQATSTAVQLLTTYAIAGIDFTPNFEIGTMRLEPVTRTVMLRINQPGGAELPPAFEIANVQVNDNGQINLVQLTPTTL